jgi:hypothetical protein
LKNKLGCSLYKEKKEKEKRDISEINPPQGQRKGERERERDTYCAGHQASQWHERNSDGAQESISNEAPLILYTASPLHFSHNSFYLLDLKIALSPFNRNGYSDFLLYKQA